MANRVLVNEDSIRDIASAIREKSGDYETSYTPGEMGNAIRNLPEGTGEGSGGSNIYVDGFSILQDGDGRIFTAIGGGYAQGGGEGGDGPSGPMEVCSFWNLEGKADTDGWVKLSLLGEGSFTDMISMNQEFAIEVRDCCINPDMIGDDSPDFNFYKDMTLTNWNYDEGWLEFSFHDEWGYGKLKFVGGEAWIYQTRYENVDDYNNNYNLTGFTLYALRERQISSIYLEATCPDDGIISIQLMEDGNSLFGFVQPHNDRYHLYVDLQHVSGETETAKLILNLDHYDDADGGYAEFWIEEGDHTGLFEKVIFEGGMVKLRVNNVEMFNTNYTVSFIHIYKELKNERMTREGMGEGMGPAIIPIDGRFIPVDNNTIFYDWEMGVIRANSGVNIDNKTISYNENGELRTAIGGGMAEYWPMCVYEFWDSFMDWSSTGEARNYTHSINSTDYNFTVGNTYFVKYRLNGALCYVETVAEETTALTFNFDGYTFKFMTSGTINMTTPEWNDSPDVGFEHLMIAQEPFRGIEKMDGAYIPVDNDTIVFEDGVIKLSMTKLTELINEAVQAAMA